MCKSQISLIHFSQLLCYEMSLGAMAFTHQDVECASSIFSVMAEWIAEMLFMFYAYNALLRTGYGCV